ncbi:MAG: hypothetical protein ACJATI_001036 [Halioglobus sp.]|jgi:uncharacterized protein (TIGR02687 family)
MILDKIANKFKNQVGLRCLFIFDAQVEYQEALNELPSGYTILDVNHRYFDTKIQLSALLQGNEKVILYHRYAKPTGLYALQGYLRTNDELRMDDVAHFMEEYNLSPHLSPLAEKYMSHFTKTNRSKLAKVLRPEAFTEDNIKRGLISIALDMHTVADREVCLMKGMILAKEEKSLSSAISRLEKNELAKTYLSWINTEFGLNHAELDKNTFDEAIEKLKYLMLRYDHTLDSPADTYTSLKTNNTAAKNRIVAFLQSWIEHKDYSKEISNTLDSLGSKIEESKIIEWYGIEKEFTYSTPKLLDNIYNKIIGQLTNATEKGSYVSLENTIIPVSTWHADGGRMSTVADFIRYTSAFLMTIADNEFIYITQIEDMLKYYEEKGYLTDTYYRQLMIAYGSLDDEWRLKVNELLTAVHSQYYDHQKRQNIHWQDKMDKISFDYGAIQYPKQYDFYQNEIKDVKTAVIISDAFRYELAAELSEILLQDKKTEVELRGALASIPSFTQMGMTNLLPHKSIELTSDKSDFVLSIDGVKTISTNREKILQKKKNNAIVLLYPEIAKMNTEEVNNLFKSHPLVYIYHNHVDATGDKRELEGYTFNSCNKAIQEIYSLTKKLNSAKVYHQYVTADHGFLYNHRAVEDIDKEDMPSTGKVFHKDSRCCIIDDSTDHKTGYAFPLKNTTQIDTELQVLLPKAINRYRRKGNIGLRFVHGGGSLQELVVPILKYYRKSNTKRSKVKFKRIDNTQRMTSSLKVSVLQENAISPQIQSRSIVLGLYDLQNELMSNSITFDLNQSSDKPSERTFNGIMTLTTVGSSKSFVYLRAMDVDDVLNPIIDDKIIITNITEIDEF